MVAIITRKRPGWRVLAPVVLIYVLARTVLIFATARRQQNWARWLYSALGCAGCGTWGKCVVAAMIIVFAHLPRSFSSRRCRSRLFLRSPQKVTRGSIPHGLEAR